MIDSLRKHVSPGWVLVAPFLMLVVVLYLGPILNILWLSLTDPEPGLQNYQKLYTNDTLLRIIWTTFRICLITTIISVAFGYSIAYAMVHAHKKRQKLMLTLLLVSFWISILVRTFSWLMLLGHNGLLNNALETLNIISEPVAFVRNELGVLIGMVHYMVPYAVLPLLVNMQTLDTRVMSASRNLGATGSQTFFRIYLPLTKPGIVAACLLVFILSLGFYVTPAILGGGKVLMVAEYISVQLLVTLKWGTAAMLAALMLFGVLALLYIMSKFMKLSTVFGGSTS
ncbi:ABC transporter permease [Pseudohalocynthiibacter aestuariivivens]|uniref:ABC transporter permease n=1 Tax=Pseudohalocynthiibacter aestuariivivens TaxID=1591409 RepID=A0ABV5JA53_9RHOB|nr:ABC transporter permease [Pseudohalocynthiibacter sp. F2068]